MSRCPFFVLLALTACGGSQASSKGPNDGTDGTTDSAVGTGTPIAASDLDDFLNDLPTWDQVSPPVPEVDAPTGEAPTEADESNPEGEAYRCTTTAHSLSTNPDEIATASPDAAVLWPGALLHGDSHLSLGSLRLLAMAKERRAPLGLSLQGGGVLGIPGGVSQEVQQPVGSTVREAINQLVANAIEADVAVGAGTSSFQVVETHSTEQSLLALSLDARYLGGSISGSASEEKEAGETVITATFVQRLFTVAVDPPENPSDLFAPEVTGQELADLGVGPDNLPLYIDSVSYGRMLIVTMRAKDSAEHLMASLEASLDVGVGGGTVSGSAEMLETLASSEIEVFALGGPNAGVQSLIQSGDLNAYFETELALNQVEPISFTVRNVGDNRLATVGSTTEYDVEICDLVHAPLPEPMNWWPADGDSFDAAGDHDFDGFGGSYGAGRYGQAWSFEGDTSYLLNHLAPLPVEESQSFAISAWVYPRDTTTVKTIASQLGGNPRAGDWAFRVNTDGRVDFFRRPVWGDEADYVVTDHDMAPANQWTHVAATYGVGPMGEDALRIYVNGVLQSGAPTTSVYDPARGETYFRVGGSELGAQEGDKRFLFKGDMDELMLFDRALSSDEMFIHTAFFEEYLSE